MVILSCTGSSDQAWKLYDTRSRNWNNLAMFLVQFSFWVMLGFFVLLSHSQKEGFSSGPDTFYFGFGFTSCVLPIDIALHLPCVLSGTFSVTWIPAVGSWTCFFTSHILCKICLYCVYLCHPGYYKILLYHWSLTVLV